MQFKNKALIVTMTCGEGHNSVARAISEKLSENGADTKIVELFCYSPKRIRFESWQILFTLKYFKKPYHKSWNWLNKLKPENRDKLIVHGLVRKALPALSRIIQEYKPSCIFSTHPYANVALNNLKAKAMIDSGIKTVSVLTDYCVHPYWEAGIGVDYVITPFDNTTDELIKRGFSRQQINVLGLPILKKFYHKRDRAEVRYKLGIDDKFTILMLSGGHGVGNDLGAIKEILKTGRNIQILCMCGKNSKAKKIIDTYLYKNNIKNVVTYSFIDNIEEFMFASDCAFSGGGAVSLTELLTANVPIIIRENMITNEHLNKRFFMENGLAIGIDKKSEYREVVENLYDNPQLLQNITEKQRQFSQNILGDAMSTFLTQLLDGTAL